VIEAIEACRLGEARTEPRPTASTPRRSMFRLRRAIARLWPPSSRPAIFADADGGGGRLASWVTTQRQKLRAWLDVPPLVLAGGLGLILLIALLRDRGAWRIDRSRTSAGGSGAAARPVPSPAPKRVVAPVAASSDELAAAVTAGATSLEDLAVRYADDPAVWRALVRTYTKERRGPDSMRAVGKLVQLNERAAEDEEVEAAVTRRSPVRRNRRRRVRASRERAGQQGPDLLYDLSASRAIPPRAIARAKQTLTKPAVKAHMSPALALAIDLRNATGCEARGALGSGQRAG